MARDWLVLVSSVCLALPALRALGRIWLARQKDRTALRLQAGVPGLRGQEKTTVQSRINALQDEAHDLIEFAGLIPPWAIWASALGIVLGLVARALPLIPG